MLREALLLRELAAEPPALGGERCVLLARSPFRATISSGRSFHSVPGRMVWKDRPAAGGGAAVEVAFDTLAVEAALEDLDEANDMGGRAAGGSTGRREPGGEEIPAVDDWGY